MNYCHPTKEQLISDYATLNLSHQEIAEKYGFKTRQVIHRLFKKYDIKSRSKKESSNLISQKKLKKPSKEELEILYQTNSISKISKILNISRAIISKWIGEYDIEKTYFKNNIDNQILKKELEIFPVKKLCIKYKIVPNELKRRIKNIPSKVYNLNELENILELYDIHSKYFARQICNDDINVYNSILELTKNHYLQSNKFTERIYRLTNNIKPEEISKCKKCQSHLKFYTLKTGYGNTEHNICRNCITTLSGSSKPSQELFWRLYKMLDHPTNCNFAELNNEKTICVNNNDKLFFNNAKLNKKRYHTDFTFKNKIIEYNGDFWHKDKEKEIIKNRFFRRKNFLILNIMDSEYKKNSEKVIEKCIKFLIK